MVIKVLFPVLVLCTIAVVAVVLAIHFRVKKHLRGEAAATAETVEAGSREEPEAPAAEEAKKNSST